MAKSLKEWERLWVERNERRGTSLGPNILSAASSSSSCARHPLGREHKPASSTDTLLALLGEYTGLILADKTSGNNIHFIIYRITEDDIPVAKATRLLRFQAFSHHCDAIDKAILKVVTNGYTSIRTVLAVIKEELDYPNVDINPEGDLSRIFQVLKNKTGINFYRDIDTAEAEMQVETVPSKIKQPILARGRLINPEVRRKLNEWTCLWTERKWRCSPDKIAIGPRISASDYSSSSTADSASVKKKKMIEPSDGVVFLALLGHYSGLINAAKTQGIDFQNGIYRLNHEDIPVAKAIRFFRMQIFSHHVDAVDRAMLEVIEKKYIDISVILAVLKEELNYPEVVINPDGDLHLIFAVVQRFTHVNFYEDIGSVDEEIEKVTAEKARKEQEEREHIRRESLITPEERKRQAEKEYQEKIWRTVSYIFTTLPTNFRRNSSK